MMRAAACLRRPAIHLFSSSQARPATPRLSRLLHHFPGASSPSTSPWQQRTTPSPIARSSPLLHVPSRSYRPGSAPTAKRHLYVVLLNLGHDEYGFDIHKLDMDDHELDGDPAGTPLLRRLPEPPALHVATGSWTRFAALGSSIVATGDKPRPAKEGERTDYPTYQSMTAIYDTETAELATSDLLPPGLGGYGPDRVVPIGNSLYAFESSSDNDRCSCCEVCFTGGLHCLRADAAEDKLWKWRALPNSRRFSWSCNKDVSELPFDAGTISAYAAHPRGRTLFVSAGGYQICEGTFTYGTESGKWKRRGDWELPFRGQGHYDSDLDAWVGLRRLNDTSLEDVTWETSMTTDGHMCACRVTSAASASRQPPEWKVSKETLFREDPPGWSRLESRLVYMTDRGEYCLVEHLVVNDTTYVLRLGTFRAKYDEDGELTTTAHRPPRSYEVPSYDHRFDTQVFWM